MQSQSTSGNSDESLSISCCFTPLRPNTARSANRPNRRFLRRSQELFIERSLSSRVELCSEHFAKSDQPPTRVCLHCSDRHVGDLRNFALAQAFQEPQFQDLPLSRAQPAHEHPCSLRLLSNVEVLLIRSRALGRLFHDGLRHGRPTQLALSIDQPTARDHGDKCRLGRSCGIEPAGISPDFDEDVLNGIFRVGVPPQVTAGE